MSFKSIAKTITGNFNFTVSVTLNKKEYAVPVIKNMGYVNRSLKENWFFKLLKSFKLPENTAFVDVGVNVGQTMLAYKSCQANPYIGFEPNPNCSYYVSQLIQTNNLKGVNIIPVGLSNKNDIVKFYTKNEIDAAGTTVESLRPGFYDADNIIYVPVFSFDDLKIDGANKISLIKIDVEGGELEVLQGMQKTLARDKPIVICEILDSHNDENIPRMQERASSLIQLMQGLNYDVYHIKHPNDNISLEKISMVKIIKWTPDSWQLNDYLFLPSGVSYEQVSH